MPSKVVKQASLKRGLDNIQPTIPYNNYSCHCPTTVGPTCGKLQYDCSVLYMIYTTTFKTQFHRLHTHYPFFYYLLHCKAVMKHWMTNANTAGYVFKQTSQHFKYRSHLCSPEVMVNSNIRAGILSPQVEDGVEATQPVNRFSSSFIKRMKREEVKKTREYWGGGSSGHDHTHADLHAASVTLLGSFSMLPCPNSVSFETERQKSYIYHCFICDKYEL